MLDKEFWSTTTVEMLDDLPYSYQVRHKSRHRPITRKTSPMKIMQALQDLQTLKKEWQWDVWLRLRLFFWHMVLHSAMGCIAIFYGLIFIVAKLLFLLAKLVFGISGIIMLLALMVGFIAAPTGVGAVVGAAVLIVAFIFFMLSASILDTEESRIKWFNKVYDQIYTEVVKPVDFYIYEREGQLFAKWLLALILIGGIHTLVDMFLGSTVVLDWSWKILPLCWSVSNGGIYIRNYSVQ